MTDGRGKRFGAFRRAGRAQPSQFGAAAGPLPAAGRARGRRRIKIHHGRRLVDATRPRTASLAHFATQQRHRRRAARADGVHSTVRKLIDPNAPGRATPACSASAATCRATPSTWSKASSTSPRASEDSFGYALTAEGDTGWFTSVPSAEPITGDEARRIGAPEWLRRMRELYGRRLPGARHARRGHAGQHASYSGRCTSCPARPAGTVAASRSSATPRTSRPTAPAGRVDVHRERDPTGPLPARPAGAAGVPGLREAAPAARGEGREYGEKVQPGQGKRRIGQAVTRPAGADRDEAVHEAGRRCSAGCTATRSNGTRRCGPPRDQGKGRRPARSAVASGARRRQTGAPPPKLAPLHQVPDDVRTRMRVAGAVAARVDLG